MNKQKKLSLKEVIVNKRMIICILNGFTAGLPIYFLSQLIPAWLRSENVDLKTIGFFGVVLLPYSFKYLWAPILDRYVPPFLGRRRGWMMISQLIIFIAMAALALLKPAVDIELILYVGLAIAFFSATQDIVLDAYRRELLPDDELGLGNAYYANAYRVSGYIPGGLGLILAGFMPWSYVFIIIAIFMGVGVFQTLWIDEIVEESIVPKSLKEAVFAPFIEFFKRDGFKQGLFIIFFIFFYKFGDTVATALQTPFFLDVGFTTAEIGSVAKIVGLWATIAGGTLGGIIMFRLGINKSLWVFGFVQLVSILGFALLNEVGANILVLGFVVAFEYLGVGLGSAALMAYIASHTNKAFTGTQLALLTSIFAIPKSFAGIIAGVLVEGIALADSTLYHFFGPVTGLGYTTFFIICMGFAIPGMLLLLWVAPWNEKEKTD